MKRKPETIVAVASVDNEDGLGRSVEFTTADGRYWRPIFVEEIKNGRATGRQGKLNKKTIKTWEGS